MKSSKLLSSTLLIIIYTGLWYHLNEVFLNNPNADLLLRMNGSGTGGYSSLLAYGTYYTLLYLIFCNIMTFHEDVIYITRMKNRGVYIHQRNREILLGSIAFSTIIIGVNIVLSFFVLEPFYLHGGLFYFASFIQYIGLILYYWWFGLLFHLLYDIINTKAVALLITFLIGSMLYFIMYIYKLLWTPIRDMALYEMVLLPQFSTNDILFVYIRQILLIAAFYTMGRYIFIEKDILNNEK